MTASSFEQIPELDPLRIRRLLDEEEATRQVQLEKLPPADDQVSQLYRDSIVRVLEEIRAAKERLADGTYGDCRRCGRPIPSERLRLRPWATTCAPCGQRW